MAPFSHAAALVAAALVPAVSLAQSTCRPAASTNEARLLAFFGGPLSFAVVPGTFAAARGAVVVAGELTLLPEAPASIRRSSGACGFDKPENSALAPVFPRPRVAVGLGRGVVVEASWLPPVTVADATPHLGGVAASWTPPGMAVLGATPTIRVHATMGGVDGPVTCPRDALQTANPAADCYGTTPSDDTYNPNVRGIEAVLTRVAAGWQWYGGLGFNAVAARFRVNFTDQRGFVDNNVVEVDLARVALLGGVAWEAREALHLSAQVYSVPEDATTARLGMAWRVR